MEHRFTCLPATFESRPNRFLVYARLLDSDQSIAVHCPDPGRLTELLIPGVRIHVSRAVHTNRKTQYDLRFVEEPDTGQLVSLDTRLPNGLVYELLSSASLTPFAEFTEVHSERSLPIKQTNKVRSRIDFYLCNSTRTSCWLEVKSVTLVANRTALFPDAPTARGRRHLEELARLAAMGQRCATLYIVQRPDADSFAPNCVTDAAYADALTNAVEAGMEAYAYTCSLSLEQIEVERRIPICLRPPSNR